MNLEEKLAELRALEETAPLGGPEGAILPALLDVLDAMAQDLDEVRQTQDTILDVLDSYAGEWEEDDQEEAHYTAECPSCGQSLFFGEDALEGGEVICPECGAAMRFAWEEEP